MPDRYTVAQLTSGNWYAPDVVRHVITACGHAHRTLATAVACEERQNRAVARRYGDGSWADVQIMRCDHKANPVAVLSKYEQEQIDTILEDANA